MSLVMSQAKPVMDFRLSHAENEIFKQYGDSVSIINKGKSITKFGRNDDIDSGETETIWEVGGDETYPTTNAIDTLSSSVVTDDEVVTIEGHTVVGTGTDLKLTFVTQQATVNGQTKVTLSTPLARVSRAFISDNTVATGDLWVYEDTAITNGEPNDLSKAHITIKASLGDTQSFKAATSVSNIDYLILTSVTASVSGRTSGVSDISLQIRRPGQIFRPVIEFAVAQASGANEIKFDPAIIVPKNSDVRLRGSSSAANLRVFGSFQGYFASVMNDNQAGSA